jgi:hypothetical protein
MIGTDAPNAAPSEVAALQEKWVTAEGADAFGCADALECLLLSRREKYCHNGGMAFAPH